MARRSRTKTYSFVGKEGTKQSPLKKRRHLNAGHSPTLEHTGRPKDDETHPEDSPEKTLP